MKIGEQCKEILEEHQEDTEIICHCRNMGSCSFSYLIDNMLLKTINFIDKIGGTKYKSLINNLEDQTLKFAGKVENHYLNLKYKGKVEEK